MNQNERRKYLIELLLQEKPRYEKMRVSTSPEEQRRMLRSLINIRMPKNINNDFLREQDNYLSEIREEKGIVSIAKLKERKSDLYIWQGDITRLQVGAIVNAANSGMTGCYQPCHNCIDNCIHNTSS